MKRITAIMLFFLRRPLLRHRTFWHKNRNKKLISIWVLNKVTDDINLQENHLQSPPGLTDTWQEEVPALLSLSLSLRVAKAVAMTTRLHSQSVSSAARGCVCVCANRVVVQGLVHSLGCRNCNFDDNCKTMTRWLPRPLPVPYCAIALKSKLDRIHIGFRRLISFWVFWNSGDEIFAWGESKFQILVIMTTATHLPGNHFVFSNKIPSKVDIHKREYVLARENTAVWMAVQRSVWLGSGCLSRNRNWYKLA